MKKLTGSTITARAAALTATATVAGAMFATVPQALAGDNRAPVRCNSEIIDKYGYKTRQPGYETQEGIPCYIPVGSSGEVVKILQRYLNEQSDRLNYGTQVVVDGQYGPATRSLVAAYQKNMNETECLADPSWGDETLATDGSWGLMTSRVSQERLHCAVGN